MKRTFVAVNVEPHENLLRLISSFKSVLKDDIIKWTNPGNIHITLTFIGDTEEKKIPGICKTLKDISSGFGEFELSIKGAGVFKSYNDPRIIWTGVEQSEKLNDLNKLINSGLRHEGLRHEERPFKPHITLGRIKQLKQVDRLRNLAEKYAGSEIQKVTVTEVIFFESILLPTGPLYKQIDRFKL
jgi:RNA 2',3'-cyclic 3'-phosphodiesterase